jgi:hypothetical protein
MVTRTRAVRGLALAAVLLTAVGCGVPGPRVFGPLSSGLDGKLPVRPTFAAVQMYKAPLQVEAIGQKLGPKVGKAKVQGILIGGLLFFAGVPPILAWGDASVAAAAKNGGITQVQHLDYEILNILGIYVEFTVIAYGS